METAGSMNIEYGFQCPSNQQFIHRQSFLDYANRRHVDRPDSMNIDAKYITPINSPDPGILGEPRERG